MRTVLVGSLEEVKFFLIDLIFFAVPTIEMLHFRGILGALGIQLMTVGLYPLTQIYQMEEDKKHNDMTIAIYLGITATFHWAITCIGLATLSMALLLATYYSRFQATLCSLYLCGLMYSIDLWRRNFHPKKVKQNFGILHNISYVNSALFSLFVAGHFCGILTNL